MTWVAPVKVTRAPGLMRGRDGKGRALSVSHAVVGDILRETALNQTLGNAALGNVALLVLMLSVTIVEKLGT